MHATHIRSGLFLAIVASTVSAQSLGTDRITTAIDTSHSVTLPGHVRTLAKSYIDEGLVRPSQHMDGLILYLQPAAAKKKALDRLLVDLHDPGSARYHQWLTPEQYADQFGVSTSDMGKIVAWLESRGFRIAWIGRGRTMIVFNGTTGMVEETFHTEIHRYRSPTATHYANATDPSVPQALRGIVGAIGGLDDFLPEADHRVKPAYTSTIGTNFLAPGDFATIYDFASLLSSGIDGTGQNLVVVGESSLVLSDLQKYNATYGLSAPNVEQVLVPNLPDPGQNNTLTEADLDLEVTGAVARNATILYVYSTNAYTALTYAVDRDLAPVINASFHLGCDASIKTSELSSYRSVAQQANAEGITWVNSSGDIGAAGCDANGEATATMGLASRFPADIPEVTAVGGTQFNDQNGNYWAPANGPFSGSALSYIPEVVWNETSTKAIMASAGGVSAFFPKPSWQTGPGVPDDGQRDIPDVAVAAGFTHDGYLVVVNGNAEISGETSAAAPLFSGMIVLLNQYLVAKGAQAAPGLGNLNIMLYRLAQSNPSAFHDITSGNNIVPCAAGSPDCANGQMGYTAGPGYDLCTGLGSVDLANLAEAALGKPVSKPTIVATANGASFEPVYAPGMIMSIFGTQLGAGTQEAGALPLPTEMQGFQATVNGVVAPLYYVSAKQANVQIPYGTSPGAATLVVHQGVESATSQIQIATAAPGIFTDGNGNTVPNSSGSAGEALVLFITGDGEVSPPLATGSTPPSSTPVGSLPKSVLSVSLTIGGQPAQIVFHGIPSGLVGTTQINFVVPAGLKPGPQPVVVTVGTSSSKPAMLTILAGSGVEGH